MTLASQFATAKQSRILKSYGIDQDNHFFFLGDQGPFQGSAQPDEDMSLNQKRILEQRVSAYSCAELGVMLDGGCESYDLFDSWNARYDNGDEPMDHVKGYPTEAAARAQLLIMRLQNKRETAEEVNARLKG